MKNLLKVTLIVFMAIGIVSCGSDDDGTPPLPTVVSGGVLTGGPFEFTVGDGIPDNIQTGAITLTGNVGSNSTYVITDADANIMGLPPTLADVEAENFDGAGGGTCLIWHLSFEGVLEGAEKGKNANDIKGELSLSNSITVERIGAPLKSIAEIVTDTPEYSSLLAAVVKAGLAETLSGPGTFTVFAPDNAAFDKFLGDLGVTLDDVPADALKQILLNHVLGSVVKATDVTTTYVNNLATYEDTDANLSMYLNTADGVVINGGAKVVATDIMASNGVIHAVDAVIPLPTVVTFATADPTFSILVQALTRDDLTTDFVGILSTSGEAPAPFTVFAPTDDAFGNLLAELGVPGLSDIPVATLDATLKMHAVAGANVRSDMLPTSATTLGGEITIDPATATITDANDRMSKVIVADVQAANGVIHVVDKVILPQL